MIEFVLDNSPYLGLIILIGISGCGVPIPEEAYIVTAGVLAADGRIEPHAGYIACTAGVFIGDLAMYGAGYLGGPWASRMLSRGQLKYRPGKIGTRLLELANRHKMAAMFLSHFTWGLRPLTHFVIGAAQMPPTRFLTAEVIVASAFSAVCFAAGYYVGEPAFHWIRSIGIGAAIAIGLAVLVSAVAWRFRRHLQTKSRRTSKQEDEILSRSPECNLAPETTDF